MTSDSLIILIILLLTINLIVVGIYLVLVLKDVRGTLLRVNTFLDTVDDVTNALSNPVRGVGEFVSGVSRGIELIKKIKSGDPFDV